MGSDHLERSREGHPDRRPRPQSPLRRQDHSRSSAAHDRGAPARSLRQHLNKVLEEHRTAVRNVRRDGNEALKKLTKEKKISEDDEKRALEEVQKMTDGEIRRMEELSQKKEAEVMQV